MITSWVAVNILGGIVFWSHYGERAHRYKYPSPLWNIDQWTLEFILICVCGIFINWFFWLNY